MTVSLSHTINERGIKNLDLLLGPITFYFVTSGACVGGFKMAKLGGAAQTNQVKGTIKMLAV